MAEQCNITTIVKTNPQKWQSTLEDLHICRKKVHETIVTTPSHNSATLLCNRLVAGTQIKLLLGDITAETHVKISQLIPKPADKSLTSCVRKGFPISSTSLKQLVESLEKFNENIRLVKVSLTIWI
mgnify:CR=1 FL=1